MQDELNVFERLYKLKHSARVLNWDHALGTVTMIGRFKPGVKELSLSLYQAIILLLFNSADQINFTDIAAQTRIGTFVYPIYLTELISPQRIRSFDGHCKVLHAVRRKFSRKSLLGKMWVTPTCSDSTKTLRIHELKSISTRSKLK